MCLAGQIRPQKGLDTLKKRISDYVDQAKPGTPGYALLNQIKNNLKNRFGRRNTRFIR